MKQKISFILIFTLFFGVSAAFDFEEDSFDFEENVFYYEEYNFEEVLFDSEIDELSEINEYLPRISIVNNIGYPVYYLFISPSEYDNWGSDILQSEVISNGTQYEVILPYPLEETCMYNFKVIDVYNDEYYKWEIEITPDKNIVFVFADIKW